MAGQPAGRAPGAARILDAALALASETPWRSVTMEMIADRSGATLARVHAFYPTRTALLAAFLRRVDEQVLKGCDPADSGEPARERLLDVLLRRFDALGPHKEAVRSMSRGLAADPAALLGLAPAMAGAMAWSLEAAGIGASGLAGALRVKGLAAVWASAMRVWLRDDADDLSATAAHLDRSLRRAETLLRTLTPAGRRR